MSLANKSSTASASPTDGSYTSFMLSPAQFIFGIGNPVVQSRLEQGARAVAAARPLQLDLRRDIAGRAFRQHLHGRASRDRVGGHYYNTISAWVGWATSQRAGFNEYQLFFGWRTLTEGWHTFILVWQISESIFAFASVLTAIYAAVQMLYIDDDRSCKIFPWRGESGSDISNYKYPYSGRLGSHDARIGRSCGRN